MKKFLLSLFVMCMVVFPMVTYASELELEKVDLKDYNTMNLIETLQSEEIEVKLKDYKETDDQITVYLFRGTGCAYCRAFLTFLNNLPAEYYNKIKVVSFDAWYDEDASILLANVSSFMGEEAGGVPYIIIGKTAFPGYATEYDEGIKAAIDAEYAATEKYDLFAEYNDYVADILRQQRLEKLMPIVYSGIVTVVCTVIIILYVSYSNRRLLYAIKGEETYHNLETDRAEVVEEKPVVVETKKPVVKHNNNNKKNTKNNNKKVNK